jgi:hypothetical protein
MVGNSQRGLKEVFTNRTPQDILRDITHLMTVTQTLKINRQK